MKKPLLLIFLRAPVLGKVKTRLAATLGEPEALRVYRALVQHTLREADQLNCARQLWWADDVAEEYALRHTNFSAHVQVDGDLGERMRHAFDTGFENGYSPIIIIGTDCPGITSEILHEAFVALDTHDTVIGPARDGGYYLLGLNAQLHVLFTNRSWSTATVFTSTVDDLILNKRTCQLLPELIDVDTEEDLRAMDLI